MNSAELDQLVAQIGEEILARVSRPALSKAEGLNIPDQVCPGCTQRCPQTCAVKTRQIVAVGADRVSASDKLTRIDQKTALRRVMGEPKNAPEKVDDWPSSRSENSPHGPRA